MHTSVTAPGAASSPYGVWGWRGGEGGKNPGVNASSLEQSRQVSSPMEDY